MKQITILILLTFSWAVAIPCHANDDVVERMEVLVKQFSSKVNAHPPSISPPNNWVNEWYLRKIYLEDVGYDVEKSNSLVSPFSGVISYDCSVKGRKGLSKEDVSTGPYNFDLSGNGTACIAKYAFQKKHWVKKSVLCKSSEGWVEPTEDKGTIFTCASLLPVSD